MFFCNNRGRADEGDLAGALADCTRAIELDPNLAAAHYNLACIYAFLGDADQACAWLAKAIALDPKWRDSARTNPDFDSIREAPCFQALIP